MSITGLPCGQGLCPECTISGNIYLNYNNDLYYITGNNTISALIYVSNNTNIILYNAYYNIFNNYTNSLLSISSVLFTSTTNYNSCLNGMQSLNNISYPNGATVYNNIYIPQYTYSIDPVNSFDASGNYTSYITTTSSYKTASNVSSVSGVIYNDLSGLYFGLNILNNYQDLYNSSYSTYINVLNQLQLITNNMMTISNNIYLNKNTLYPVNTPIYNSLSNILNDKQNQLNSLSSFINYNSNQIITISSYINNFYNNQSYINNLLSYSINTISSNIISVNNNLTYSINNNTNNINNVQKQLNNNIQSLQTQINNVYTVSGFIESNNILQTQINTLSGVINIVASNNTFSNLNVNNFLNVTGGSKIVLMNNADGGTNGIWLNSSIDPNWTIYRSSSVALSSGGIKCCAGYGSFTSSALRLRVYAGSDQGLLIENSNEDLLFSINGLTGETYISGNAIINGDLNIVSLTTNGFIINSGAQDPSNQNCGYGFNCLNKTYTGLSNTGNGCNSLYFLTSGSYCSSYGSGALYENTTGNNNSSFGYQSGYYNQTGNNNSSFGFDSLFNNLSSNNTAIGSNSGINCTTLNACNNTFIGCNADFLNFNIDISNSTAIGYNAKITASNQIKIGTANQAVEIDGSLNINNINNVSGIALNINSTGQPLFINSYNTDINLTSNTGSINIGSEGGNTTFYSSQNVNFNNIIDVDFNNNGNVNISPAGSINLTKAIFCNNSLTLPNNSNSSTNKLFLAGTDLNHSIYSTGSNGNAMYFNEYNEFIFYSTERNANSLTIDNNGSVVTSGNINCGNINCLAGDGITTDNIAGVTTSYGYRCMHLYDMINIYDGLSVGYQSTANRIPINTVDINGSVGSTCYYNNYTGTSTDASQWFGFNNSTTNTGGIQMTYYNYWLILQGDRNLVLYDKSSGSQVAVWNAGSEVSDRNLKKNIKPTIHNGIDIINKLEVVDFQYIEALEPTDHLTTHTGLIAQDIINIIPNSIKYFENKDYTISGGAGEGDLPTTGQARINLPGNYLINYDRITPFLIKALQEQQVIIDSLVSRISILESKII